MEYATWYTLEHGHIPGISVATTYTGNLVNGTLFLGEFGRVLLNGPLLLVTGQTSLQASLQFYSLIPWPGLVALPSMIILGVHAIRRSIADRTSVATRLPVHVISYALATLGFPSLIYFTASSGITDYFGWILLALIFYSILKRTQAPSSRTKFSVLAVAGLLETLIYHHTTALFLALLLGGVLVVQLRRRREERAVRVNLVAIYCVVLISYVAYLTFSFKGYLLSLEASLGNLASGLLGIVQPSPLLSIATTNQISIDRVFIRLADSCMILVVFAVFIQSLVRRRVLERSEAVIGGLMIGTVLAATFLVGWGGFGAFFIRISALSAVVTILGVGFLIMQPKVRTQRKILALGVAVVVLSPIAYISGQPAQQTALRFSESSALLWVDQYVAKDETILSDSRLASPLVYFGFRNPLGFEDEGLNASRQELLLRIHNGLYHPKDPAQVAWAACEAGASYQIGVGYAVYSTDFAGTDTGIVGYVNTYYPADSAAGAMWGNVTSFQKVYDSGTTAIFQIPTSSRACGNL